MSAPKPLNFDALTSAWDDPERFARELNTYYAQLGSQITADRAEPRHENRRGQKS